MAARMLVLKLALRLRDAPITITAADQPLVSSSNPRRIRKCWNIGMPDHQLKSTTDSWSEVGSHVCTAHAPMGFKKYPVSLADGAIYRRRRQRNSMLPLP